MSIPKFHKFMKPILEEIIDGKEVSMFSIKTALAKKFDLTQKEQKELLPSGNQAVFDNRVGWARTYLKKAKMLSSPQRGFVQITNRGRETLKEDIAEINVKYLKKFPEFIEFQETHKFKTKDIATDEDETPIEVLEESYKKIKENFKKEILDLVMSCSPFFFEKLVVDLLINLGYGGSKKEAGEAFTTSGDEGLDGIIKEDKLGLDLIYIQAKRWKKNSQVGRPEIQKFAGALQGRRAKKGVFITTSYFSNEAKEFVKKIESKIILIDGDSLAEYMIESNTGVSPHQSFEIKKIDADYFDED